MKRIPIVITAFLILVAQIPVEQSYRFENVRGKVLLGSGEQAMRVSAGQRALGGDVVRTGWLGHAVVSADHAASRFEIYPGSRVILASDRPGVLIKLEQGKLKALFDVMRGDHERFVETPGALLAVRGTRYGLEVGSDGRTRLMVFEGAVEVRPFDPRLSPALVRTGQMCEFRHGERIRLRTMPRGMNERTWDRRGSRNDGDGQRRPQDRPDPQPRGTQGDRGKPATGGPPH